jgi:hypothetical protein
MKTKIFQNRMMRNIFGSARDAIEGDWRKVYNEEFHN